MIRNDYHVQIVYDAIERMYRRPDTNKVYFLAILMTRPRDLIPHMHIAYGEDTCTEAINLFLEDHYA